MTIKRYKVVNLDSIPDDPRKNYWFFREAKLYYKVSARTKEEALALLEQVEDTEDNQYFDRVEVCMDWEPYGVQSKHDPEDWE